VRIEHAKKLLAQGTQKMEMLGSQCGYQSVTGFWVAFKQATGFSPREYRKRLQE
jgi:YesN/AraC family two-component response regulator